MKRQAALICTVLTWVCATSANAVIVSPRNVINSGGRAMANSTYQLNGSIGQSAIGTVSGLSMTMIVGYWGPGLNSVTPVSDLPGHIWSLNQNHPNPFNPVTTISFSLASASRVRLEVYSVRGQRIRSLVNEDRGAGSHQVVWDGRDASGRMAASGPYFARLVSNEGTLTKKMMLVK